MAPENSDQENNIMRLTMRTLTDKEEENVYQIKTIGTHFHEFLDSFPGSREMSLAKTNLEQAVMWAVKDITG